MTGGGFGGSVIVLGCAGRSDVLADAVTEAFAERGFGTPRRLPMGEPAGPAHRLVP